MASLFVLVPLPVLTHRLTGPYSHTVEELQAFSNTRTPSPPWVHAIRVLIPVSCCDEAALHLIQALGGEEHAKRIVGGTKWWQVRGIPGYESNVPNRFHE